MARHSFLKSSLHNSSFFTTASTAIERVCFSSFCFISHWVSSAVRRAVTSTVCEAGATMRSKKASHCESKSAGGVLKGSVTFREYVKKGWISRRTCRFST